MDPYHSLLLNLFFIFSTVNAAEGTQTCSKDLHLRNGTVQFQSRGGITAIFSCNPSYTLRGSNVSHCQTDGHWSAPLPSCIKDADQGCVSSEIETILVSPGHSITINCSTKEINPESSIFWTSNGAFINSSSWNMASITPLTSGLFICLLQTSNQVNILRSVKVEFTALGHISVEKCELEFKNKTSMLFPEFGSRVSLSCEVNSFHVKTFWMKDGKYVSYGNRYYSFPLLHVPSMSKMDEGNYTCLVNDERMPQCYVSKSITLSMKVPTPHSSSLLCGQPVIKPTRRLKRVIDGNRAAPLSAPWMCMLSLDAPICGCSLISHKWAVTAAHCFKTQNNTVFMTQQDIRQRMRVKFGKQHRRQAEKGEVVKSILRVVVYPKYKINFDSIASEHDIALIELNSPVTFQASILPVCLPPPEFMNTIPSGTLGIVTGWGRVSVRDSIMALTLQEAFLPLVNNSSCQRSTNYVITENMLCAGYAESYRPDTCSGDSGGPFVIQKFNSWYLVGIVSWGEGCSSPKKFGIYTRVERYVSWIQSVIKEV